MFGCAYWRIAEEGCSATTLRRRRDEWIDLGVMDKLEEMARESYDRVVGLELSEVAIDCCITKAPCGGENAGRSPVDRGKRGMKRSVALDAAGIPLGAVAARAVMIGHFWHPPWALWRRSGCPNGRVSTSTAATTRRPPAGSWRTVAWWA